MAGPVADAPVLLRLQLSPAFTHVSLAMPTYTSRAFPGRNHQL